MLSKNQIRYINSLQIKKYRQLHKAFIVEGTKSVIELLNSDFEIELLAATDDFCQKYESILSKSRLELINVSTNDLEKLGTFQTNDACLAVARTKENQMRSLDPGEFALMLDDVRDPGNLGTIIRIADWYGITKLVCSESTTDFYNPKVIASSKGSFCRVQAYYTDLSDFIDQAPVKPSLTGTFMEGESIYQYQFPTEGGYLVFGNESSGISPALAERATGKVTIPRFGGAESLNVAIAGAIVLDNLKRFQSLH